MGQFYSSQTRNNVDETKSPKWVPVLDQPVHTPRKIRVVCVGAGVSGLILAHKYKYELKMDEYVDFTIYEKNQDVGGTWFENRYPGVACDVPAHIYVFPFEPNPDYSSFYAAGPEIWEYIKRTTTKYHLDEHVQFNSKVISTVWDEGAGSWKIKVQRQDGTIIEDSADVLVNASGILNKWRWPDIKGLHSFRGKLLHSASWDSSLDWTGKRVAIIGNGSSAIQILPKMQSDASSIVTYIRSPTWITANYASQFAGEDGKNFFYTEEQKKKLRENPEELYELRHKIETALNQFFWAMIQDSPQQAACLDAFQRQMKERIGDDQELQEKLIPKWAVGCRRVTPGDGYLEALREPNVTIDSSGIQEITPTGIISNSRQDDFDIIVCATGFDVSFSPFWEVIGKNGISLAEQWKEDPEAYFGICAPNMPNYFIFHGPNCPIGHGSLMSVMDFTAAWILRWCQKIATEGIKSIQVRADATEEYNIYTQEFMKRTVWTGGCRSWYKNNQIDGKVTAMYAGSILHYKEILESFRTEDFIFEYRSRNRFQFMGNGLTVRETTGGDMAYYLQK
ncbi:hypothetical protein C8Q69DRAFT_401042 [Paecilomyces variotii]|uniref:Flavin-binding monooxygenase n=1 Tax=Byssochlamys spectabilis TaxID=264951 RepID=A0A443HX16_BYSSP|nr:hypothetical protein C8Q69DRAFT_401042 [Paecilomyces variotii]KAJ9361394.1 hypothetical protein DTO280E4_3868 [Paecilomyces variotii]RWQ96368.1 hypothetical protein C8Q69DRAFT_401042 [Paecilomyces variotii]